MSCTINENKKIIDKYCNIIISNHIDGNTLYEWFYQLNENERIKNDLIRLRDDVRNILEIIKNQTPEIKRVLLDIISNANIKEVINIDAQLKSMIDIKG